LKDQLDEHAAAFARDLDFDLAGRTLAIDSMWVNVLAPGGAHSGHIHPLSVLSGTYYVSVPDGAGALKLEDPRLAMMMAAPPQKARVRADNRRFVYAAPSAGIVLLWESWLRHEVPVNGAKQDRISISFNYALS
ncbi:MAG TPA: TIGR02466 family protein, partial [Caulobacterales bacterium]|nr:TIGR02466 family protein [Caulobacterales bacterium]